MKNLLIAFITLVTSVSGFARSLQVCYTDINVCGMITVSEPEKRLMFLSLRNSDFNKVDEQTKTEFRDAGVLLIANTDEVYDSYANKLQTEYRSFDQEAQDLSSISDEAWGVITGAGYCAVGVTGCVGGVVAALETGGLAVFFLKVACGGVGIQCTSAIRSYQKYVKYQKKLDEQAKAGNYSNSGGTTTDPIGGGAGVPSQGNPGPATEPGFPHSMDSNASESSQTGSGMQPVTLTGGGGDKCKSNPKATGCKAPPKKEM